MPRRRSQARRARDAYARSACCVPERLRARPESPATAGIASTSGIRKRESCARAPEIMATSVDPRADGVCSRACHDRSDFGSMLTTPRGGQLARWHAGSVNASTFRHDLIVLAQPSENCLVDALPKAGLHPFVKPTPTSHATAAAEFARQVPTLPRS